MNRSRQKWEEKEPRIASRILRKKPRAEVCYPTSGIPVQPQ